MNTLMNTLMRALALVLVLLLAGCNLPPLATPTPAPELTESQKEGLKDAAEAFIDLLAQGNYQDAHGLFGQDMAKALPVEQLHQAWDQIVATYGAYTALDIGGADIVPVQGNQVLACPIHFSRPMDLTLSFDGDGRIAGFFITEPKATPAPAAEGIVERDVSFASQPDMPLSATVAEPDGGADAIVVMVHGSGPNDRDQSIGPNAPFRDIAHGLAQRGIASLRYDKVTYSHPQIDLDGLTVDRETALDAVAAAHFAREMGYRRVYILGHSQGGMLASYIQSLGANADGLIVMAGSPRPIYEISADQNRAAIEAYRQQERDQEAQDAEQALAAELADVRAAVAQGDAQGAQELFGFPADYLLHWAAIDAAQLHLDDPIPSLFMQGGRDVQVLADVDFALWKEALSAHPDATFLLYERLNHLFGDYRGDPVSILDLLAVEYAQSTPVPDEVIEDIAQWIFRHEDD